MKKFLFWILTFLWIWLSFCSADYCWGVDSSNWFAVSSENCEYVWWLWLYMTDVVDYWCFFTSVDDFESNSLFWEYTAYYNSLYSSIYACCNSEAVDWTWVSVSYISSDSISNCIWLSWWSSTLSDIDVYYNNWNSVETITCDWTQAIDIRWLSTITNTNTFAPYYNISYTDEDNQKLTESYSKDILYLSGWLFKKTYTWDNERILTDTTESPSSSFSWYLPTFEITWWIEDVTESWNIFNNFAENSVKFVFSNIPSYIQYVLIFMLLFFILRLVRPFKKRR